MKKLVLVLIVLMNVLVGVAQPPQGPPQKLDFEKLQKELNLSQDQLEALKNLELKDEKGKSSGERPAKLSEAERKKMHEAKKLELAKILSEEQMEKLDAIMKEKRSQKQRPQKEKMY